MKVVEARAPSVRASKSTPVLNALEPYERLVRTVESCALEGDELVSTCPALRALQHEIAGVSPEIQIKVGEKMIGHASPAVRVQAASMMRVRGELTAKSLDAIARVAHHERDPRVLAAFVRIAGKHGATNPSAAHLLLAAANHANSDVRLDAISAITAVENRGMRGVAAKLVVLAETDTDPRVRRAACAQAGRLGTDDVLPLYERATAQVTDPAHYAACMEGLAAMFHNHPSFDTASEAAYRLFLRRIEQTPRTEHSPPWSVMSIFCYFSHEADLERLAAWKHRATWFDANEVKRVLSGVIADRNASMQARSAAIESLVGLGVTPVELASLKKTLDKPLLDKLAAIGE